ncbi:hypothetical protein JQX09_22505 [Sulfitobacter pseudonitzschiae]|uniref:Uncharacterized protein n=1 Tax=Pseudosulfitobacter pseudonitzschiae TaxID=1402135 RepID=A0A9Q2P6J8_9RHOB|nr:DUF6527 family protein [Pseudosulfitobacter pseudonitzschiae]MBM2294691.1 hypothetical protein [Pseudosulfitobacter pseudonitzschiae]MBM2299628.1 hypothetical protein [Pseudosulfitobacter pseudonitzschiae]MBM2304535.1 hypothetical protein [Pseudosulfitobacter pseudonitzschiae]MBM2314302.1 hypothetical protein [Pseudosulfitobacter pseudonitzschiae]MBM2319226.1 hypothetical protein [Pseudosulfitobacter pseudonitzschiae]
MIRAIHFVDREDHRKTEAPGSIFVNHPNGAQLAQLWFYCPCGCGDLSMIDVGHKFKPDGDRPTWDWNGEMSRPTLSPSVHNLNCGWHGWLRDGYWESC